jgi:hypothetical protein
MRLLVFLAAAAAFGQQQQIAPHAGYVYPAGGRQGTTFEVTVGGQALNGVNNVYLSGPGATVKILEYERPLTNNQANMLREEMQELQKKRQADPAAFAQADIAKLMEIRDKLQKFIRRPMNPAIAETVRIEVVLAADAAPGRRELRLATPAGMTNPVVFQVGTLPEWTRKNAEAITAPGVARPAQARNLTSSTATTAPVEIAVPVVINGQIMPGAVDRYRFPATKGQHLVIAASARELIPYISDAVPGWFQATLALKDASGREVQYADHYTFHQDPVLHYEIPSDGAYTLEIKDSIYRGREDFVYRIEVGELPFVTGMFPLGGKVGARTGIQLTGWNLPSAKLTKAFKTQGVEAILGRAFAVDALPEAMEKEPNDRPEKAQKLKAPVIVNGRIQVPGDQDVYRFDGKAGEEIVAEIVARRLDSPLDSVLRLTDAKGREIAINDDTEDKSSALQTHHADSHILAKLPASGTYYLYVADSQQKGGTGYAYRLRVSRPQPDFELRVTPSGINARSGLSVPVSVYAIRRDGFQGEIAVKLKDPGGFHLDGATIPAGVDSVRMTLTAPAGHIESPQRLAIEGQAVVGGREVRHAAVAADDMMQAFYYHHLTAATDLVVRVLGPQRPPFQWRGMPTVKLPAGGTATVHVLVPPRVGGPVTMELNEPPDGITIQSVAPAGDGVDVVLKADPVKAKPGLKGNLILDAFVERTVQNAKQQQARRKQPLGTLPAAPFEVSTR